MEVKLKGSCCVCGMTRGKYGIPKRLIEENDWGDNSNGRQNGDIGTLGEEVQMDRHCGPQNLNVIIAEGSVTLTGRVYSR